MESNSPSDYARFSNAVQAAQFTRIRFALECLAATYQAHAAITMNPNGSFLCEIVDFPGTVTREKEMEAIAKVSAIIEGFGGEVV